MPLLTRLLVVFLCLLGTAQAEIPLLEFKSAELLKNPIEVLEDKHGDLVLADVLSPENDDQFRLVQSEDSIWRGQNAPSAYWFRLRLLNTSAEFDWFLQYAGSLNLSIAVYLAAASGAEKSDRFKSLQAEKYVQGPAFFLHLVPDAEYILYYRIQDKSLTFHSKPVLLPMTHFIKSAKYNYPRSSFMVGGLLILALYNLFYFLHLRDRSFLWLALFIFSFTMEMAAHPGLWHGVTWMRQTLHSMGWFWGFLCIAFILLLLRQWLNTAKYQPIFDQFWRYMFWCCIGFATVSAIIPFSLTVLLGWASFLTVPGLLNIFLFIRQGRRLPRTIVLAATVFLIAIAPSFLFVFNINIGINLVAEMSIVGLLLSLALLSLHQAAEMRSKNEQVGRIASANQARDEFLTTMSHELRTPMSSVVSAGQLLNLSTLSTDQSAYVSRLNTSSTHMLSLINNILDLARLDQQSDRAENIPFKLDDILQQTEQLLAEQVRAQSIKLIIDNRFHLLKKQLLGDPTWLRQILLNLLSNAIKFTEQGEVKLTITPEAIDNAGATILFDVTDTGVGIAKERQGELFQPFSQADSSTSRVYGGSGLGLAISHKLVNRMGGVLQLESEPGEGSRFFFTLRFQIEEAIPEIKPSHAMTREVLTHIKSQALLVDDNEMNRFFNSRLLKSLGVDVTTVDSGKQALQSLQQASFDVIFIDVNMPEMDGYETTRRIRSALKGQTVKIIALTAHAISGERQRCLASGMDDYLPKPFTRQALEDVLYQHGLLTPLASSQQQ